MYHWFRCRPDHYAAVFAAVGDKLVLALNLLGERIMSAESDAAVRIEAAAAKLDALATGIAALVAAAANKPLEQPLADAITHLEATVQKDLDAFTPPAPPAP